MVAFADFNVKHDQWRIGGGGGVGMRPLSVQIILFSSSFPAKMLPNIRLTLSFSLALFHLGLPENSTAVGFRKVGFYNIFTLRVQCPSFKGILLQLQ